MELTPEPLPYTHLTLDAAHWTLASTELQHLVLGAIRLLPPSIIDIRMPEDAAHIECLWGTRQQPGVTLSNLDLNTQSLLHATTHRAQLASARDTHRASALAVALRKFNASYARRTRDLDKARAHIAVLRDEVHEAWKFAGEQADKDKSKMTATAMAAEPHEFSNADTEESVAEDDNLAATFYMTFRVPRAMAMLMEVLVRNLLQTGQKQVRTQILCSASLLIVRCYHCRRS